MKRYAVLLLILPALLCGACGKEAAASGTKAAESGSAGTNPALITTYETLKAKDMFSKKDLNADWDENFCASVVMSDSGVEFKGEGASVSGTTVTITDPGSYLVSGSCAQGQILIEVDKNEKVHLILNGLTLTNTEDACILVQSADKVIVTLAEGSVNTLRDFGDEVQHKSSETAADAVIFSRDDLSFNGSGTLEIQTKVRHGIVSKNDLVFAGGAYHIDSADKGVAGNDSVRIRDSVLEISAEDDAIHTKEAEKPDKGFVYMESGTVTLISGDDAVHAATALAIEGGTLTVTQAHEGLEAATVTITGGKLDITSDEDPINASFNTDNEEDVQDKGHIQNDAYIRITGGDIKVYAGADGIDSNGWLYLEGGTISVDGKGNSEYTALDSGLGIKMTGAAVTVLGREVTIEEGTTEVPWN